MTDTGINNDNQKNVLRTLFESMLPTIHPANFKKVVSIINSIPEKCRLDKKSYVHALEKKQNHKKLHPVRPHRGDIYNVLISEDNVGKELNGNHLCVVVSNKQKNIYSEKVNIVPIEGDGFKIDPKNNIQLTNDDLVEGKLNKVPSKIIGADIMTIDKARLDVRIGRVTDEKLDELSRMIKNQLGI